MRIPLDYYRILGVPIQATEQQLSQAYHDRALQLPRREYSDATVNARKQLLDEAYSVLSDPERRSAYDANFLAKTYEPNQGTNPTRPLSSGHPATTPWLEINQEQFVGALLLLHELGEYELVLQLGQPLLEPLETLTPEQQQIVSMPLVRSDIVLTLALTCLEWGRAQWQQGQSEQAAASGQIGQSLLLQEGLFPNIRGEIQADLYKLRPYRVLELLSQDLAQTTERQKGIQLLYEMFQERGGIDGNGDDQSGLGIDDFLRFIQQIRSYLTVTEQQDLFEQEARRPSAVASYLAVYSLVARGFVQRQPVFIARSKEMLVRLCRRQDVHLEQAVCALLLGQTEEASRSLELSQEYEPLAFIRENSQDSPDLLPGLCLYGERWLQTEVFPHFRDLANEQASLKDYFADEQVQQYLEQTPEEEPVNQWSVLGTPPETVNPPIARQTQLQVDSLTEFAENFPLSEGLPEPRPETPPEPGVPDSPPVKTAPEPSKGRTRRPTPIPNKKPRRSRRADREAKRKSRRYSPDNQFLRYILLGIGGILVILIAWFAFRQVFRWLGGGETQLADPTVEEQPTPTANAPTTPSESPTASPTESPTASPTPEEVTGELDENVAEQVVSSWLSSKASALGEEYQLESLETVLAEPLLSEWRNIANQMEENNEYRDFRHNVEIENVEADPENPDVATVDASVQEVATAYRNGEADPDNSYDSSLRVRYFLIRNDGVWQIRGVEVL